MPEVRKRNFHSLQKCCSTYRLQLRRYGAIPIVVLESSTDPHSVLPFAETLDWDLAAITVSNPRLLQPLLESSLDDVTWAERMRMRRQGRKIWESYLSSRDKIMDALVALIRQRIGVEPPYFKVRLSTQSWNKEFNILSVLRTSRRETPQRTTLQRSSTKLAEPTSSVARFHRRSTSGGTRRSTRGGACRSSSTWASPSPVWSGTTRRRGKRGRS